jgi:hypothetical protein
MILAEHVADDRRAFLVRTSGNQTGVEHRVQHATVYRLESIADIGQRP